MGGLSWIDYERGDFDASLVRYHITWSSADVAMQTYDGVTHNNDGFYDVAARGAYIYAVGATRLTATDLDLLVTRWTTSGAVKWATRFGGAAKKEDSATDVGVDGKGNVMMGFEYADRNSVGIWYAGLKVQQAMPIQQ